MCGRDCVWRGVISVRRLRGGQVHVGCRELPRLLRRILQRQWIEYLYWLLCWHLQYSVWSGQQYLFAMPSRPKQWCWRYCLR